MANHLQKQTHNQNPNQNQTPKRTTAYEQYIEPHINTQKRAMVTQNQNPNPNQNQTPSQTTAYQHSTEPPTSTPKRALMAAACNNTESTTSSLGRAICGSGSIKRASNGDAAGRPNADPSLTDGVAACVSTGIHGLKQTEGENGAAKRKKGAAKGVKRVMMDLCPQTAEIPTTDILTKAVSGKALQRILVKLGMWGSPPTNLRGRVEL